MALHESRLNSVKELIVDNTSPVIKLNLTVYDKTYTHSVDIKHNGVTVVSLSLPHAYTGTYNEFLTLTAEQQASILNAMPNVRSMDVIYVLTTYKDGTVFGATSSVNGTIRTTSSSSAPLFSGFTFSDANSVSVGVTGNDQVCIQAYSNLSITCETATPRNGAVISEYVAQIGSKRVASTSPVIDFGTIDREGDLTLTVMAVDSRGYRTIVNKKITIIAYTPISISSWDIHRINNFEKTTHLSFTGSFSPVEIDGTARNSLLSVRYRCKITFAPAYSLFQTIHGVENGGHTFSFDNDAFIELPEQYSYYFQIEARDKLGTHTVDLYVEKGTPLVSFRSGKVGINTNSPEAALDVNGDANVDGCIKMNGYNVQGFVGELDTETDLNDVLTPGIYFAPWVSRSDLNYPTRGSLANVLEVIHVAPNFVIQRFTAVDGQIFSRGKSGTTWHPWISITSQST